jgi:hypothetical protein
MSHDFDRSRLLKEGVVLPDACKAFSRVLPLLMTQTKATQPVAALAVGHAERGSPKPSPKARRLRRHDKFGRNEQLTIADEPFFRNALARCACAGHRLPIHPLD